LLDRLSPAGVDVDADPLLPERKHRRSASGSLSGVWAKLIPGTVLLEAVVEGDANWPSIWEKLRLFVRRIIVSEPCPAKFRRELGKETDLVAVCLLMSLSLLTH